MAVPRYNKAFLHILTGFTVLSAAPAYAENNFNVGVEGFRDNYQEPGRDLQVDTHTDFGSVTAGYEHNNGSFFTAIDLRYSQGNSDYKSLSGTANNIPDKEGEIRVRTGMDFVMWHGVIMPYIGIGSRLFYDKFKEAGPGGYDRHITQLYAPLGATYKFTSGDWTFSPNAELDLLFWGRVNSHLAETNPFFPGDPPLNNIVNQQKSGAGFRSEFMVGQQYKSFNWEFGPFVRYWRVEQSDLADKVNIGGGEVEGLVEPKNTRVQYGAALRVGF